MTSYPMSCDCDDSYVQLQLLYLITCTNMRKILDTTIFPAIDNNYLKMYNKNVRLSLPCFVGTEK